jgi:hypothetical protein
MSFCYMPKVLHVVKASAIFFFITTYVDMMMSSQHHHVNAGSTGTTYLCTGIASTDVTVTCSSYHVVPVEEKIFLLQGARRNSTGCEFSFATGTLFPKYRKFVV